jgi:hypothetical protein
VLLILAPGDLSFPRRHRRALAAGAPALQSLCDAAGCAIHPLRDAAMGYLSIEASDLQADPAHRGLLILTATLRNRAPWALSYPYLELTLTVRRGLVSSCAARWRTADYAGRNGRLYAWSRPNASVRSRCSSMRARRPRQGIGSILYYP